MVTKHPRIAKGTLRSMVGIGNLNVQGWQKVLKSPGLAKGN